MIDISNIENKIKQLQKEKIESKAKLDIIEEQYADIVEKIEELKELDVVNKKAIELLNMVQKATKEIIQDMFEGIITKALCFIHQSEEYQFALEFDKRGNNPKMSFMLKTPDMQESHNIMNTRAGGSKDIIALALRLVLLEISKNKGFLFLDEPYKRLDNDETINKAIEFVKETQRETNRQIFIITHKDEVVNSVSNPIIIK